MTSSKQLTPEQLLELAALDAFGLLDEVETERFDTSFHNARASVQDEILRVQSEFASDVSLLPDDDAPADLRARVLNAVNLAIADDAKRLAPLATIGRSSTSDGSKKKREPTIGGHMWRAAALLMFIVSGFLGYYAVVMDGRYTEAVALFMSKQTEEDVKTIIGPSFAEFAGNPNCVARFLAPVQDDGELLIDLDTMAGVWINERTDSVFLTIFGELPDDDERYTLVAVQTDGERVELATFEPLGSITGQRIDGFSAATLVACTFEIVDSAGIAVLRS